MLCWARIPFFIALCWGISIPCLLAQVPQERERQKRKAALMQATDPVGKAKAYLRLSDLDLKDATREASQGDLAKTNQWLQSYTENLRQAELILRAEHEKKPKKILGIYREFDILLGKQLRRLNELKNNYAYDQQDSVSKAIQAAESAQEEMLSYLFGEENVRGTKKKEEANPEK
jgi:hypothetical protein